MKRGFYLAIIICGLSSQISPLSLKWLDSSTKKIIQISNLDNIHLPEDDLAMVGACNILIQSVFKKNNTRSEFVLEFDNTSLTITPDPNDAETYVFILRKEYSEFWSEIKGTQDGVLSKTDSFKDDRGRVTRIESYEKSKLVKTVQLLYENNVVSRVIETDEGFEYDSSYDADGRLVIKLLSKNAETQSQSVIDYELVPNKISYEVDFLKRTIQKSTIKDDLLIESVMYEFIDNDNTRNFDLERLRSFTDESFAVERKDISYDQQKRVVSQTISNKNAVSRVEYTYEGDSVLTTSFRNGELVESSVREGDSEKIMYYSKGRPVLKRVFNNGVLKSEEKLK